LKTSCEIIKDLIPLYHDNVCSAESGGLVEGHIRECPKCAKYLSDLSEEFERPADAADEAKPIKAIQTAWKKDKAKSFVKGTVIGLGFFALLVGAFIGLTQWHIIPVPTKLMEISEVSSLHGGAVGFNLALKDDKQLRFVDIRRIDGALYMTPKRAAVSMAQPEGIGPYSRDMWFDENDLMGAAACYIGTPEDRILIWREGMELPPASEKMQAKYDESVAPDNIQVTNESAAAATWIGIDSGDGSTTASYGDNALIPRGGSFGFHLAAQDECAFTVKAGDAAGNIIAQADFVMDVTYDEPIQLYIRDGEDGHAYISDV
jgi:hypothetical protein